MQAVILKNTGTVAQLQVEEVDLPVPKENEVLVKTKAFSINPIEIKTRKGNRFSAKLLSDPPSILGWDASGIVVQTGQKVQKFKEKEEVFGVIGFPDFGKTYAEYFIAREDELVKKPKNISFQQAAASNIAALTAYQALKHKAQLKSGMRVLIHAASGGVGHFGVQIANSLGAQVYATASLRNHDFLRKLGADILIDYNTQKFEEEITQEIDVVFDLIGGDYIDRSLKVLKKGGLIICIPTATNEKVVEKAQAAGSRGIRFIMQPNPQDMNSLALLLKQNKLKAHISKEFKMKDIAKAHTYLEKGHTRGKIVVLP